VAQAEELLENAARRVDDVESCLSQLMEKMSFREEHMRTMLDRCGWEASLLLV
jgi:hypothetical protein